MFSSGRSSLPSPPDATRWHAPVLRSRLNVRRAVGQVDHQHGGFGQPLQGRPRIACRSLQRRAQRRRGASLRARKRVSSTGASRVCEKRQQLAASHRRCVSDAALDVERRVRAAVHLLAAGLADAAVPVVARRDALRVRQERQEVELALHAQEVHVQARVELMADVAEDIEVGDQQIVDALEQRVADDPGGLGRARRQSP